MWRGFCFFRGVLGLFNSTVEANYCILLEGEKQSFAKCFKNLTACYWVVKEPAQYKVELHPYTVRKDALPEFFTDVNQMYDALLNKSGATGVFTDFPDTGVEFLKKQK